MLKQWEELSAMKEFVKGVERVSGIELSLKYCLTLTKRGKPAVLYRMWFDDADASSVEQLMSFIESSSKNLKISEGSGYISFEFDLYDAIWIDIQFQLYQDILVLSHELSRDAFVDLLKEKGDRS